MFCTRCGVWNADSVNFCRRCGARFNTTPAAAPRIAYASPYPYAAPACRPDEARESATPYFVWSLVLFFFINVLGTPLSAAAAVCAARANAHGCLDPESKLASAKMLCIAATIIDAATLAVIILLTVMYAIHHAGL